jgi:asparagine synthase (glutamine-hydrolysing)
MCGISGIIPKDPNPRFEDKIRKMNSVIETRGPDHCGVWNNDFAFLGHTRLSIVDTEEHSNQPFVCDENSLVFNGEIYNFIEIREELIVLGHKFKTNSDTEVLIKSYKEWGKGCVEKFNGMFAFCIIDNESKEAFFARDRIGIKPFYYCMDKGDFYFFSEPKQVVITNLIEALPNFKAITEYLAYQFPLDNKSMFSNILSLDPGTAGIYSKENGIELTKYWDINDFLNKPMLGKKDAEIELNKLLNDSVELRLRAGVETGSYLSGGIDSTIIASLAASQKNGIKTFTFSSGSNSKYDESIVAKNTAKKIGAQYIEETMEEQDFWELWKKATYIMDEPRVGYSLIPQILISQKVRNHLKVVLGGQGGDELFWGYGWNNVLALSPFSKVKGLPKSVLMYANYFKHISGPKSIYKKLRSLFSSGVNYKKLWLSSGCASLLRDELKVSVNKDFPKINDSKKIKSFEIKYWLRAILHVEDRSSMSASIESRVPMLDHRIVELSCKVPLKNVFDGNTNKRILVSTFGDFFEKIGKKQGFTVPLEEWFTEEKTSNKINGILQNPKSFIFNFIKFNQIQKFNNKQIWMLISLELWHTTFIKKETNKTVTDEAKN